MILIEPMGVNFGTKAKYIPFDLYFELVAQLGYKMLKLDSLRQFLVALGYQTTIKWYSDTLGPTKNEFS